ncbi:ABC transporter permease [Prevotella sp. OH937_COT-195]|uniref:ABC transporter permease n=1 Tax=Prevotella sp. OH937_COT-195 TaxID=2491051 RepID=UPI000F654D8F|nr:ABC transporter permease [Prevotella sp. OH937_COT-195]RRD02453.1 ABC transporter permease [Prevotella sp. OH937_COT-195]
MLFDIDRHREILDTITRNKSRSLLTGFGVFWGIFMLVALLGGGNGLREILSNNFDGFATNSAMIWAQRTTKPYNGLRKGRSWSMNYNDVIRLREQVSGLEEVQPMISEWGRTATNGDKRSIITMKGLLAGYQNVEQPKMRYGRYINEMDIKKSRKVCVIGKKVYKEMFAGGGDPCGKRICIDNIYYSVVGVDYSSSNININGSGDQSVSVPLPMMQQAYNKGDTVHIIAVTARRGVAMSDITDEIRSVIASPHHIDPNDDKGISIFNSEVMFGMMDNLFSGVNFMIMLVGIGTLLAGIIGVSNIMMVTVKERTTEIGIRRAIGATPTNILSQIMTESMLLTTVAGMTGILFSVLILELLELANTTDGILVAKFQIGFWSAVAALALLSILGMAAGLAPALRAMKIKPVDAMRDDG